MSISEDAEDFVATEWHAAIKHAQVDESEFHLITCPGAPVHGEVKAVHFERGGRLDGDPSEGGIVVQQAKLDEANADENLWRHRIAVYEDIDPEDDVELAYLAGLLRHEIEHGKQRMVAPEAFGLYELTRDICGLAAAGDDELARQLFGRSPIEADANAAASAHIHERCPQAVAALAEGPDSLLVARDNIGDPRTLIDRTVDYLWQFSELVEGHEDLAPGRSFADLLYNRAPGTGAGDRWRSLLAA
ncbi:MAG: hypothetical protein JWM53_2461 [bacterium]|nr:hypothetical protein [bacterium]